MQGFHKSIILSVAGRCFLVQISIYLNLNAGKWFQTIGEGEGIVFYEDLIIYLFAAEHVSNYKWQIFSCHILLLISEFNNSLCHFSKRVWIEEQPELFEVFSDCCFP